MIKPFIILLVEDNPGDARLTEEALKEVASAVELHIVPDGEKALQFLRKEGDYSTAPRPHFILLDLNLPKMDGHAVLQHIKTDESFRMIPVAILSTSRDEDDISRTYFHHANCYLTKPIDLEELNKLMESLEKFWLSTVQLPENR